MSAKRWEKRSAPVGGEPSTDHERIEAELSRRGVSPRLARQLADLVCTLGPGAAEVMRAAAFAAASGRRAAGAGVASERPPAPDVDEIGRLMAGFVNELQKLDEALQLLAAYLMRLREQSVPSRRVLH